MDGQKMIRGYQWGSDGSYIGVYDFPDNQDREAVHLPPHTTLLAPPKDVAAGYEAAWDGAQGVWVVRVEDMAWMDADSRAKMLEHQVAQAAGGEGPVAGSAGGVAWA